MNAKLNEKLSRRLRVKYLACWFLIAATYPQVLAFSPAAAQTQVSANKSEAIAVASRITDINSSVSGDRLNLTLNFASSDRPQVTYARQGKDWIAVLNGAQLQLGSGNASYTKSNPAPGITAIEATPYETNKVRIRVTAASPEVFKDLIKRQDTSNTLVFSLEMQTNSISSANAPESGSIKTANNSPSIGKPLFEPKVTITAPDGTTRVAQSNAPNSTPPSATNPVTPQLQGRVPGIAPPFRPLKTPPVGDIATSTSRLRSDIVELGSAERVPRITLRNAPAIEVLTLIGRVAGLSVVSADTAPAAAAGAAVAGAVGATSISQPVSLSIENETAQDVFNNVLRITGLEANRIGNTVFVATKLPLTLKNVVTKTYRLNQVGAADAAAFLVGLGAERVSIVNKPVTTATTASISGASTTSTTNLEEVVVLSPKESTTAQPLQGMRVIIETRGNSLTLIGAPNRVNFAEAQLARLDLRKPQVAVNVRIVSVTLDRNQTVGSLLGFNASDGSGSGTAFSSDQGALAINFNSSSGSPSIFTNPQRLFALISAKITNNSGKVISDPTLVVQEGENGQIDIGDEILTLNETGAVAKSTAGLKLSVKVSKIDDNGFINLSIVPEVSVVGSQRIVDTRTFSSNGASAGGFFGAVDLLTKRAISSGLIRMRDGQSLILSGVIQDSDREAIAKVPFLGDLPIIGALFRNSTSTNTRSETIIIVTPRIIDDSQNATWGYTYQPGAETQKVLDSNQIKPQ
jgi:type IV pilus assembly protein PilQ